MLKQLSRNERRSDMERATYGKISLWGIMANEITSKLNFATTPADFLDVFTGYVKEHSDDIFYYNRDDRYIFGRKSDFCIDEF
jgi:hypothetical protein